MLYGSCLFGGITGLVFIVFILKTYFKHEDTKAFKRAVRIIQTAHGLDVVITLKYGNKSYKRSPSKV